MTDDGRGAPQLLVSFTVEGKARPKGSLRPILRKKRNGQPYVHMMEQSTDGPLWRRHVAAAAREAIGLAGPNGVTGFPTVLPVEVGITFGFQRPKVTDAVAPTLPTIGDLDKLIRNVLDALTDAGVYQDDRLVVRVVALKVFLDEAITTIDVTEAW